MRFRQPKSGNTADIYDPVWVPALIFGTVYFLYKQLWLNAIISLIAAIATVGLSWFVYPFFSHMLVRWEYRQRGWLVRDDDLGDTPVHGVYANQVIVREGACPTPHRKIARVSATTYKSFPFSDEPTQASVEAKLRDEALRVGANEVINVSYRRKSLTLLGWGALIGEGLAIRTE